MRSSSSARCYRARSSRTGPSSQAPRATWPNRCIRTSTAATSRIPTRRVTPPWASSSIWSCSSKAGIRSGRHPSSRRARSAAMTDALLVFTTLPSADKAAELAKALIEERLAACANLLPAIRSIYRWQGKLQDENEVLVLLKTRAEHLERLKLRILELHPYEVPEVLAVPVEAGYQPYLEWLAGETK